MVSERGRGDELTERTAWDPRIGQANLGGVGELVRPRWPCRRVGAKCRRTWAAVRWRPW